MHASKQASFLCHGAAHKFLKSINLKWRNVDKHRVINLRRNFRSKQLKINFPEKKTWEGPFTNEYVMMFHSFAASKQPAHTTSNVLCPVYEK